MKYQIRTLERADLLQAAELERRIFSEPWSLKSFEDALKRNENIYVAAEAEGKIIGYCGLWAVAGEGQIYNVAVAPEYRNQKIGEALLEELLERGWRSGLTAFTLEVRKSNEYAIRLYQKSGFKSAGIRKNFYDLPKEDAVIMWLRKAESNQ